MPLDAETKKEIRLAVQAGIASNADPIKAAINEAVAAAVKAEVAPLTRQLMGRDDLKKGVIYRLISLEDWRDVINRFILLFILPIFTVIVLAIIFFILNVITGKATIVFH